MTITVTQLNNYIHGLFDMDDHLNDLSVIGEITNVKQSHNGWYFSVKDENASVNCFCYFGSAVEPQQGAKMLLEGKLNFFVRSGSVSFFVRKLVATDNKGEAYLRFVELRDKLSKEGLFDEARKRPVPNCAARIGVVTSRTGAVIHDIETVALRRQPFTQILLYPVRVQGDGADIEIAQGIEFFGNYDVDAVIVGRGGGSNEDLSVFNSEAIVRAIAACPKPIVSAVGHGVDFTLADFAADKRAATPSEAAELVTLDVGKEKQRIVEHLTNMSGQIAARLAAYRLSALHDLHAVQANVGGQITAYTAHVKERLLRIAARCESSGDAVEHRLDKTVAGLQAINPLNVLKRGYAYVYDGDKAVRSAAELEQGREVGVRFYDGSLRVKVISKEDPNET